MPRNAIINITPELLLRDVLKIDRPLVLVDAHVDQVSRMLVLSVVDPSLPEVGAGEYPHELTPVYTRHTESVVVLQELRVRTSAERQQDAAVAAEFRLP